MTFSRYAGPGSHRYPVGFSGDSYRNLGVLEFPALLYHLQLPTLVMAGGAMISADICLAIETMSWHCRWVQLGVFSPINASAQQQK
ncbi:MAG: TIM-barrel domain-containing protein [Ruminococcus sp.]